MRLAAIENNENTGRVQATVKHKTAKSDVVGALRYKIVFPKQKKKWVAKPIYEAKQYGFVYDMLEEVLIRKMDSKKGTDELFFDPPVLALKKNIASEPNPGKARVIEEHKSRY